MSMFCSLSLIPGSAFMYKYVYVHMSVCQKINRSHAHAHGYVLLYLGTRGCEHVNIELSSATVFIVVSIFCSLSLIPGSAFMYKYVYVHMSICQKINRSHAHAHGYVLLYLGTRGCEHVNIELSSAFFFIVVSMFCSLILVPGSAFID